MAKFQAVIDLFYGEDAVAVVFQFREAFFG